MNKLTATGRIVADAEVKYLPNGDALANFRVASDVGYGEKKSTNWFNCAVFGKRGESLAPHLVKGQQVTIFGTLTLREWVNKDGAKQISPDIRVDEIELQGGKRDAGVETYSKGGLRQPAPLSTPDNFVDTDIPF
ncbi:MAG TPA: single-stranded DNA-binding protein [Noviherbaspirillum sp.]|jgi:single-strand DNA-binding protein|uniref:single-stranded DNA-binding protein n=1 Tax=Noviherbaspirillum sp. TaxID=1926288 RepID=UPI002DDD6B1C|nr:single-stranded DNA-binding protein [Noviherbaspirillum sp.]HEV2612505.1 single-stranded DNA-binding protein [Noviherbaspirillum sp.]